MSSSFGKSLHYRIFTSTERNFLSMLIKAKKIFTLIESEEYVAKSSPVAQFALPLKMKPNRQDIIVTWSVLNLEQASLRGLSFCSLYCPLCFDYNVCSEMIINLPMMETRCLIFFNNISLPYSRPPCERFTPFRFKNPGSRAGVPKSFSDHVPLQHFDRWASKSNISYHKKSDYNNKIHWTLSRPFRFLEL